MKLRGQLLSCGKTHFFLLEFKEKERAEKYEKALAFLQEQEHGIKSGQLGKGRKRGR